MQSRMQPLSAVELDDAYAKSLPNSQQLFTRAQRIFPDGVTHDNRRMQPFPIYIERAEGAYKWDVDGHRYIDYWMGPTSTTGWGTELCCWAIVHLRFAGR